MPPILFLESLLSIFRPFPLQQVPGAQLVGWSAAEGGRGSELGLLFLIAVVDGPVVVLRLLELTLQYGAVQAVRLDHGSDSFRRLERIPLCRGFFFLLILLDGVPYV